MLAITYETEVIRRDSFKELQCLTVLPELDPKGFVLTSNFKKPLPCKVKRVLKLLIVELLEHLDKQHNNDLSSLFFESIVYTEQFLDNS